MLVSGIVLVLGFFPAIRADAQSVGSDAPAIEPADWLNAEGKVSWNDLRGRAILVDRWATWCGPCVASIPHLNAWQEKYGKRGFQIVGVTDEPTAKINRFLESRDVKYLLATGVKGVYRNPSIPHAWLVSPDGKVVWRGHPGGLEDSLIEEQLETASVAPVFELPEDLERAEKLLNAKSYAQGISALERYLKDPRDEAVAEAAREALEKVRSYGKESLEKVRALPEKGEYVYAMTAVVDLQKHFSGTEIGDEAKKLASEWRRDREFRAELEAETLLQRARDLLRKDETRSAAAYLVKIVRSRKYAETKAAEEAKKEIETLEGGGGAGGSGR